MPIHYPDQPDPQVIAKRIIYEKRKVITKYEVHPHFVQATVVREMEKRPYGRRLDAYFERQDYPFQDGEPLKEDLDRRRVLGWMDEVVPPNPMPLKVDEFKNGHDRNWAQFINKVVASKTPNIAEVVGTPISVAGRRAARSAIPSLKEMSEAAQHTYPQNKLQFAESLRTQAANAVRRVLEQYEIHAEAYLVDGMSPNHMENGTSVWTMEARNSFPDTPDVVRWGSHEFRVASMQFETGDAARKLIVEQCQCGGHHPSPTFGNRAHMHVLGDQ